MGPADDRDFSVSEGRLGVREARPSVRSYLVCLTFLSAAAFAILAAIGRVFRTLIDSLGVLHQASQMELGLLIGAICAFQGAYWYRIKNISIPPWRSVVFSHILGFTSRLSFIFGGALFSLYFLRHVPGLSSSEGAFVLVPRIAILLASLFCLYCYSLELERLANALQLNARTEE
jgi:hypothetical protein